MANWCGTTIDIYGEKEDLLVLKKKISEWTSKDYYPNGFGNNWLGNICLGSGIMSDEDIESEKYGCRGWLTSIEMNKDHLHIDTDTAWNPMIRMWSAVLEKLGLAERTEIFYSAEEPGCCLYWTNDPDILKHPFILDGSLYGKDRKIAKFFGYSDDEIQESEVWMKEYDVPKKRINDALRAARKVFPDLKDFNDIKLKNKNSYLNVFEYEYVNENETA